MKKKKKLTDVILENAGDLIIFDHLPSYRDTVKIIECEKPNCKEKMIDLLIQEMVRLYKGYTQEPLDGDEVEGLTSYIKDEINLMEANITNQESEKQRRKAE